NIKPTIGASGRKLASSNVYKRKGRTPPLDQPNLKTTPLHALHQEIGSAAESTNGLGLKETFATVGSLPLPKDTRPLPKRYERGGFPSGQICSARILMATPFNRPRAKMGTLEGRFRARNRPPAGVS